jgi:hypothetical protein
MGLRAGPLVGEQANPGSVAVAAFHSVPPCAIARSMDILSVTPAVWEGSRPARAPGPGSAHQAGETPALPGGGLAPNSSA